MTEEEKQYKEARITEFALSGPLRDVVSSLVDRLFNLETLNRTDVTMKTIMLNGAFNNAKAVSKILKELGFVSKSRKFIDVKEASSVERTNILMSMLTGVQIVCLQGYCDKIETFVPPAKATRKRGKFTDGYNTVRKRMNEELEKKANQASEDTVSQKPTETSVKSRDERGMIRTEYLETLLTEQLKRRLENVRKITSGAEEPDARWLDEKEKIEALLAERSGQ